MEKEFNIMRMEMLNMMVILSMGNFKVMADIIGKMVNIILGNG